MISQAGKWEQWWKNPNEVSLVQRVIKFCQSKMGGVVPKYGTSFDTLIEDHKKQMDTLLKSYIAHLEAIKLRAGLVEILHISALGNKLLQDNKLDKSPIFRRTAAVIALALNRLHLITSILSPYMPGTAESIFQQLGAEPVPRIPDTWEPDALKPGHVIGTPKLLFMVTPATWLEEWREVYCGEDLRRQKALEAEKAAAKKAAKERERSERG